MSAPTGSASPRNHLASGNAMQKMAMLPPVNTNPMPPFTGILEI
jgi:hypothetical protein